MKRKLLLLSIMSAAIFTAKAQDSTLSITGSVDTYYKYDFADPKGGLGQIPTSFATDHNSLSIGMVDIALKKKISKAAFVGELSFGPRGQYQSIPAGDGNDLNGTNSFHIQNLYISYDLTDKLNVTAGYMGTFIGYEVISPTANFNYSTSYLFTNGPFQNAGFKATYTFSDKVSLMAGIFNDQWNGYRAFENGMDNFGAQLGLHPVEGWDAYLNVITGHTMGTEFDLTTAYQITDMFKLGLNAAVYSSSDYAKANFELPGFAGVALYPQVAVSSSVSLGLRGEYFKFKSDGPDVKAITATANIKAGPLTFIPEVRLDSWNEEAFEKKNGDPTKSASQFLLAAVYAF
ncbi:porin [Mucilaginibacter limnophilus]|uniref:Porin n=1 Tax=Mucilaginibacter limnophilus TaxID=1932778 RepID=A0A3S2UNQ1_9SPHI|nr:porin [Mucilaginibacter limnophilus]RVU02959.1 porin [Mucilaginibacter limnophilus]